jgi:hypothetical protein
MIILTCRELVELVTEAQEGQLGWWRAFQYRAHLTFCRHCSVYVEQMAQTTALLKKGFMSLQEGTSSEHDAMR